MRTIDALLNSDRNKKLGNYRIEYVAPRHAVIYFYNSAIADINFGDNYGNGRSFRVFYSYPSKSTTRAVNYIRRVLVEAGFVDCSE
jgi:hypothetical protein